MSLPDELVFYTHPMSRGRIVRWMLAEVGQPYRTEVLDYGTGMKAPEYRAINPTGTKRTRSGPTLFAQRIQASMISCPTTQTYSSSYAASPPAQSIVARS